MTCFGGETRGEVGVKIGVISPQGWQGEYVNRPENRGDPTL
jgi:hypothetical protein